MYLAGITPEDFAGSSNSLTLKAEQTQLNSISNNIGQTVVTQTASALTGFMYTIRKDPTVKAIADSLFPKKVATKSA